jgi:drug/metabolite transporter (DMT)-like permease
VVGALVAITHTVVGVVVWVRHGEPDFYFRGWGDVEPALLLGAVLGAVKAIPLAVVLILFEWLARRRIRIVWFALGICAIAAVASIVTVTIEFERRRLLDSHSAPESIALWLGVLLGPLLSRKHKRCARHTLPNTKG